MIKDTVSYPLYPIGGTHWSAYGEALAIDSIRKYVQHMLNKKMVTLKFNKINYSDTLQPPDNDIELSLNLFLKTGQYKMAYPVFSYFEDSDTYKPKVITIADSYYSNIYTLGVTRKIYKSDHFYFYFRITPEGQEVKNISFINEINNSDVVVLLATEANLSRLGFGFIEEGYKMLLNEKLN